MASSPFCRLLRVLGDLSNSAVQLNVLKPSISSKKDICMQPCMMVSGRLLLHTVFMHRWLTAQIKHMYASELTTKLLPEILLETSHAL